LSTVASTPENLDEIWRNLAEASEGSTTTHCNGNPSRSSSASNNLLKRVYGPTFNYPFDRAPPTDFFIHGHQVLFLDKIVKQEIGSGMRFLQPPNTIISYSVSAFTGARQSHGTINSANNPYISPVGGNSNFGISGFSGDNGGAGSINFSNSRASSINSGKISINSRIIHTSAKKGQNANNCQKLITSPDYSSTNPTSPSVHGTSIPDKYRWPDGTFTFTVPRFLLNNKGMPQIRWAFCQNGNTSNNNRRYFYCLGVMQCPVQECTVVTKPLLPASKKLGAPPKQAKNPAICPRHNETLEWVPPTRDQYHCTVECLMKMKPSFLREFMDNPKMSLGKVVKVKKLMEQKLQKTK
jgi:hypothetical protein